MIGQLDQALDWLFDTLIVGMYAGGGEHVSMLLGNSDDCRKLLQRGADVERRDDIVVAHTLQHSGQILRELRKRQMAMRIDEHGIDRAAVGP